MKFTELTLDEFRAYAVKSPYRSFMQTPEIAKYREQNGWTAYYLGVKDVKGQIKAATMLVAKPTFMGKSTFIAPGGPLLDLEDAELATFFFHHLKKYLKSHNAYVLHISPYYELIERDRNGAPLNHGFDHESAKSTLRSLGFTELPHPSQPKYMFALDLANRTPDQIFASFKSNTRGHIRKAEKAGVTVRELDREELSILKTITESTSKRRDFTDQPLEYYQQMYDLFVPRGEAMFLVAEVKHTPLSAAMFMLTSPEVVYLFSGSDEKYMKEYNAQYAIQWHMIKYATGHHFARYNFYGIHGLPNDANSDGVYEFKKGFASDSYGHVIELIGTYEAPINYPFFTLHRLLSALHKKRS